MNIYPFFVPLFDDCIEDLLVTPVIWISLVASQCNPYHIMDLDHRYGKSPQQIRMACPIEKKGLLSNLRIDINYT
jgi:hypothetical protein